MGRLTEDMTGLCNEIEALRNKREGFIANLGHGVAELKEGFRNDRSEMARKMKADLRGFLTELKDDVADMKAGFNSDHADMAKKLRDDLGTFISKLTNTVGVLRKEFTEDIVGAHKAWFGYSPR